MVRPLIVKMCPSHNLCFHKPLEHNLFSEVEKGMHRKLQKLLGYHQLCTKIIKQKQIKL